MQGTIAMHRVPHQDAQHFADAYAAGQLREASAQKGVQGVLSSLNRGFVNAWPAFKRLPFTPSPALGSRIPVTAFML